MTELIKQSGIAGKIYQVRGAQVMLYSDLVDRLLNKFYPWGKIKVDRWDAPWEAVSDVAGGVF